jgi:hypothetical protein
MLIRFLHCFPDQPTPPHSLSRLRWVGRTQPLAPLLVFRLLRTGQLPLHHPMPLAPLGKARTGQNFGGVERLFHGDVSDDGR